MGLLTIAVSLLALIQFVSPASLQFHIPRFGQIKNMQERIDVFQSGNYLLMPHIYRAFIYAGGTPNITENVTVSKTCQNSLQQYYQGLVDKRSWAWKMYDSTGKQAAGVFLGATTWTGNFEECFRVVEDRCGVNGERICTDTSQPRAQFCNVHMSHAPWMPELISGIKLPFPVPMSPFIVDICVPRNCSEEDLHNVVTAFLQIDNFDDNIEVQAVKCYRKPDIEKDVAALVSALILLAILGMVVLGTSYDIYRRRKKVRVKRGPEITIGYDQETEQYGILKIMVPPRKRRRRRGTLSSSEALDHEGENGSGHVPRTRSVSEGSETDGHVRPIYKRMTSGQSGLENIPEDSEMEMIDLSESVLRAQSITDGDATDVPTDDDGSSMISDSVELPLTPNSETPEKVSMNPKGGDVSYNRADSRSESIHLAPRINRQSSIIEVRPSHKNKKLASSDNLFTDLLLSFSFRKNTRHILADGSADTLYCLNGVRVMSIGWIVLGNVFGIIYHNPEVVENDVSAVKMTQSWWMQLVINTTLAADSFFVLSGCLGAYNFMKIKTRQGKEKETDWRKVMSIKEYGFMIVHRLVRIMPCYAVLLLLGANLLPYLGRGPRWSHEIENVKLCKKNWWSNVLFISNFYDPDNMCQPHTYYLANDFQFFLFSPLILIPLLIKPKLAFGLIGFFTIGQIVVVSALNQGINGNVLRLKVNDYWSTIYVKPYSRVGVYCIGMALGYFLYTCDRQMKFRKFPLYIGWILTCIMLFLLPYITYAENREGGSAWSGTQTALYEAFSRPLWAMALSWVIFACSTGQGAFVGKFLSWNMFLPLCRITYGVFLLHPILITIVVGSSFQTLYLTFGDLVYTYIAILICSWGLAFLLISCVECPFTTFESHIRLRFKDWNKDRKLRKFQRS